MTRWYGAAAVCVNERNELLMVLQGRPEEEKTWSVPSGGLEKGETFEQCCLREVAEETGYIAEIIDRMQVKKSVDQDTAVPVEVHYFSVQLVGGEQCIQDPDQLIYEVAWKNACQLKELPLTFPEDRDLFIDWIIQEDK